MRPLKFEPLLKQLIWGRESWEISGVKGNETVVADGEYKGMALSDVVRDMKGALIGEDNYKRFGDEFPLLIKFIDAHNDLSIQVHPTDEVAKRHGKVRGKTEMWYIMESDKDASLYNGMAKSLTPQQYEEMVADCTICDALARYTVKEGDVFFIPAGRIHAIGAGCHLAEIQQTSDVTYRIFDYNRKDSSGNTRELHIKEAAECIDYAVSDDYRIGYSPKKNEGVSLVCCQHFTTSVYDVDKPVALDYSRLDSFIVLIALKGEGWIKDDEGNETALHAGETLLVPAMTKNLSVSGTLKFLECHM